MTIYLIVHWILRAIKKLVFGERNITTGIEDFELKDVFNIEDKPLDDCWILDSNEVIFHTPKYQLTIESSAENNFLQVYTPPKIKYHRY